MNQQDYELTLFAICLWREARGEIADAQRMVAWSIRNRVDRPGWWGKGWIGVITQFAQYSSMTVKGDPNTVKFPADTDASWVACMAIAADVFNADAAENPSQGATHYFDRSLDGNPPNWAAEMTHLFDSGNFHFYK